MLPPVRALSAALIGWAWAHGAAFAQAYQPIPKTDGWLIAYGLPGVSKPVYNARRNGVQIDTMLLLNNDGAPVLTVGRRDWKDLHGRSAISLSIDGGKPRALSMSFAYNIGLLAVSDSGLLGDLEAAKNLQWRLPMGHFVAKVGGLGRALNAIKACIAAQTSSSASPAEFR